MSKWEYLVKEVRTVDAAGTAEIINELGEHGWELVSVNPPLHYFGRVKEPESKPVEDEIYGAREA